MSVEHCSPNRRLLRIRGDRSESHLRSVRLGVSCALLALSGRSEGAKKQNRITNDYDEIKFIRPSGVHELRISRHGLQEGAMRTALGGSAASCNSIEFTHNRIK